VYPALEAARELEEAAVGCRVINARFAKPLDSDLILDTAREIKRVITVEENTVAGGFGSAVLQLLESSRTQGVAVKCLGLPDTFIEHGSQSLLRSNHGLDAAGIARQVLASFPELTAVSRRKNLVASPSSLK
jgi:1-deoxy-D-xylulose-5-phosphate synthase